MKILTPTVGKSLRLSVDDAAWLSQVAETARLPESEIMRRALQRMRAAESGGFSQDDGKEM
jgi:hypothetical protein